MAKRTPGEIYSALLAAGYTPAAAVVQTAIALAESEGGQDSILGDVKLQTAEWGPSYGLFQIRTVKRETGTGSDRDISWLAQSISNQAKAAYDISRGGRDFTPWTEYTNGGYQQYLGQVAALAGGVAGGALGGIAGGLAGEAGSAVNAGLTGGRNLVLEGLFVLLGVGLAVAGVVRAVHPVRRTSGELSRETDNAEQLAGVIA